MLRTMAHVVLLALAPAILAACATPAPPPKPATVLDMNTVCVLDKNLYDLIEVKNTGTRRTQTNTLEVWTNIANCTDRSLALEGRALFYDADEAPLGNAAIWQQIFIPARATGSYRENTTNIENIVYYRIEIRGAP